MSKTAIKCSSLSKIFWKKQSWFSKKSPLFAVKDLDLEIEAGESVAFLGPNGAGKSTTIKLLCGILKPTSGSTWLADYPSGSLEANKCLGLVFGTRSNLWMYLTVKQSLEMIGSIYFLTNRETLQRIDFLAELFEISQFLDSPPNTLSLGERMRCEIVASLIHRPSILLADEPTIGLDIIGKTQFRNLLNQWQEEEKATFLLTSHDISDVESLCQRAILINKGTLCYNGALNGLKGNLVNARNVKLALSKPLTKQISSTSGITLVEDHPFTKRFQIDIKTISTTSAIDHLVSFYKDSILDISISEIELESMIAQWYR